MTRQPTSSIQQTQAELHRLLQSRDVVFPELDRARNQKALLASAPQTRLILQRTLYLMQDIEQIPLTGYTSYRAFRRTGERQQYETSYFLKRARLSAAALRLFLGQEALKETIQDYVWNICEETNWVLPAHEPGPIDLFAAETGFQLAELLLLLDGSLDEEICQRVRAEIERRILDPYLRFYQTPDCSWYQSPGNWNGVCNSSIAATFLLLEPDLVRVSQALEIALGGLQTFLEKAFADDGSSTEGVSYWHYGLFNFVALAELLYARTAGAINLLAGEKLRKIAAFPARVQLSGSSFATFSDCEEQVCFHPGILTRLAARTGEHSLLHLLARPAEPEIDWRLPTLLRDILWWDGSQPTATQPDDARLPGSGLVRLVSSATQSAPLVLCIKAGHNDEQHNHNDVGSFLLHVDGESFLTDPGRGLYTREYFRAERYANPFANSYGHSVPRIDGTLQGTGRAFAGLLLEDDAFAIPEGYKGVALDFTRAYACPDLKSARRELLIAVGGNNAGTVQLHDSFHFAAPVHEVEEAFVTWMACEINGPEARIHGSQSTLLLTIEQPQGLQFQQEALEEACKSNRKPAILKRLSVKLPLGTIVEIQIKLTWLKTDKA